MTLLHDVRDTWRSLARNPYFTIPVLLSLAFAIGTNVAAFSVINALVLRSLPIEDPQRLFHITYVGKAGITSGGNYAWYEQVRDEPRSVSAVFIANSRSSMKVAIDGQVEALNGEEVSGEYFSALGLRPALGRLIASADENRGVRTNVVVISDALWSRRFGRDPHAIGKTIRVNNVPHEVIGVMRPEFFGLEVGRRIDVAVPIDAAEYRQGWVSMAVLVRLADGVSPRTAADELTTVLHAFADGMGERSRARFRAQRVELAAVANGLGGVRTQYVTPAVTVSVILATMLLLACANWATLLIAKLSARQREVSIRLALGSSRFRLGRQLFIESVSLALAGGALGTIGALWGVRLLPGNGLPAALSVDPDVRVALFAILMALLTGVLFAVAPAWLLAHIRPHDLRTTGRQVDARSLSLGRGLVVAQVALSLMLAVGATFLWATLRNLRLQEMGFSANGVVTFSLDADGTGIEGDRLHALHRSILERLHAIPGVQAATLASVAPLSGNEDGKGITIPGFTAQSPDDLIAQVNTIGPEYFSTFGIPILRGRAVTADDSERATQVAVVSENAAKYYFPDVDPIGRQMEIRGSTTLRPVIVGVAADVMYDDLRSGTERMFYVPFFQRYAEGEYGFAVRTASSADGLLREIPGAIRAMAPDMPVLSLMSVERQIDERSANERLLAVTSGFFSALAVIIAAIGIYGIVSFTITRRLPELGVRIALGASSGHVIWVVVRSSVAVMALGIAIGLSAALSLKDILSGILFGVPTTEPRIYAVAVGALLIAGSVSVIGPVARALRIDPVNVLRHE